MKTLKVLLIVVLVLTLGACNEKAVEKTSLPDECMLYYHLADEDIVANDDSLPLEELQKLLKERDIKTYESIDNKNPRRLVRALVQSDSGKTRDEILKENDGKPLYPVEFLQLEIDKNLGNEKIDKRVDQLFSEGFVDEVKKLVNRYGNDLRPFHCIGYDEIIEAMEKGNEDFSEAKELIKVHTHQYAKKQRTFLRNQFPDIRKGSKEEIYQYLSSVLNK